MWVAISPIHRSPTLDRMVEATLIQGAFCLLGTSKASSNASCFAISTGPLTTSPFVSIHCTQSHNAWSTSGLVTTRGHLHDNAFRFDCMQASISGHSLSFCDSVGWLNSNVPSGLVAKYLTTCPWLTGRGRVSTYLYTVIQSKSVRFSCFGFSISCAEVFGVSFDGPGNCSSLSLGSWTGCFCCLHFHSSFGIAMEGRETAQIDLKTIQVPIFLIWMWFLHNAANRSWSAVIGYWKFSLLSNVIMNKCTKRPCGIQYSIMVNLDRNQLRWHQNLFTTKSIHYSISIIAISTVLKLDLLLMECLGSSREHSSSNWVATLIEKW